jgi:hypothetical protein
MKKISSEPRRKVKGSQKKQSISGQQQRREKEGEGAETGAGVSNEHESKIFPTKKRTLTFNLNAVSDSRQCLPDYSADWRPPERSAPNAEIEARFYYEFARESEIFSILVEKLHEREMAARLLYDHHLHFPYVRLAIQMPGINLRAISWNKLEPKQKEGVINALCPDRPAFREFEDQESFSFDPARDHGLAYYYRFGGKFPICLWSGSSRLDWDGTEKIPIKIDWSQGSQAVEAALKKWFHRHKEELLRLKSEGKFPMWGESFQLRDETGAKNPKRKYLTALRGLGAMRLLSNCPLAEAIRITRDVMGYPLFSDNRSAWNRGIENARQAFQKLFYPRDTKLSRRRRSYGLPKTEEPVSYRRYRLRTGKNI